MRVGIFGEERKQLMTAIKDACSARSIPFDTREFSSKQSLLGAVQDGEELDAVFLINDEALEAAVSLRECGYDGEIVLCAADERFAVSGYELGVSAYLLSPYTAQQIEAFVDRVYGVPKKRCLTIRKHQTIISIPYHDILYVESNNSKCFIHRRTREEQTVYERLDAIEERLQDERFLRCHQSYLVNMDYISQAGEQFELINGDTVSIRKRDHKQFKDRYVQYLQGEG